MAILALLLGIYLLFIVFRDCFMSILLPRTVASGSRLTVKFFKITWRLYSSLACRFSKRDATYAAYGPLSMVGLIATWAGLSVVGFALLEYGAALHTSAGADLNFATSLYLSGGTFFTLGSGDVFATDGLGHAIVVIEAGVGFGFLAVVISYLPVLYNLFSRRETMITLMDARAGSPPSAGEMLRRFAAADDWEGLTSWLERWETWCAELLESNLSYPVLAYYRSQHSDTGWLVCLTTVLDTCALVREIEKTHHKGHGRVQRQARLTYAMARHAAVDLASILYIKPVFTECDRLDHETFEKVRSALSDAGIPMPAEAEDSLKEFRAYYEPYVKGLSDRLYVDLPMWTKKPGELDNWQTSAWSKGHLDL